MSYLLAGVVVLVFLAALIFVLDKSRKNAKKGGKSAATRSNTQIIKEANKRLARNPNDATGLIMLGDVYYKTQLWNKAYEMYNQLSKIDISGKDFTLKDCLIRLGICAVKQELYPEATRALVTAYKLDSISYEVNYYLGYALFKQKNYLKAAPLFKKAILAKPDTTGVYSLLGDCLYNVGRYRECFPIYKKAIEEEPGNKDVLFKMADAMFQEGQGSRAIKVFMHLRADPTYGATSCLRAGVYHARTNDVDAAIQDYEIGLKHTDASQDILLEIEYNLARCYFEKNQIPKGFEILKSIRSKSQNYKDVNSLISQYQDLSQNSNLQTYVSAGNSDFVALCRKIIVVKYKNNSVKVINIEPSAVYTDITAEAFSTGWQEVVLFRFFRTTGSTGEIYVRDMHGHMSDVNAEHGICVSAGIFTDEAKKFAEGRPIDLIEKNDLIKILKRIAV